jgi:hypothetical protein
MMMNINKSPIIAAGFLALIAIFHITETIADVPTEQKAEVEYLLNIIKSSSCIMERNNEQGTGEMAYEHILLKYDYYRDEIMTTEDFIRLAATKSVLSGEYYMIYCENQPGMRLGDWLQQELTRYRTR